jgi:hypothetical protein
LKHPQIFADRLPVVLGELLQPFSDRLVAVLRALENHWNGLEGANHFTNTMCTKLGTVSSNWAPHYVSRTSLFYPAHAARR